MYVTYAREEGRLAALNDDRESEILVYRRYLALRSEAEPRLRPQLAARARTDEVRRGPALAELQLARGPDVIPRGRSCSPWPQRS